MEYILINRAGDAKIIADYKKRLETYTLNTLVKAYNKEVNCGIVGVHRQALYLSALRQEFQDRLKESPIYILEHILGLVGPIELVNGNIRIID